MEAFARAAGYSHGSGVQRYESGEDFADRHLPVHFIQKIVPLLVGKGEPPITSREVYDLAGIAPPEDDACDNEPIQRRVVRLAVLMGIYSFAVDTGKIAPERLAEAIAAFAQSHRFEPDTLEDIVEDLRRART